MKKYAPLLLALVLLPVILLAQPSLELALFELPDVIFEPIDTPEGFQSAYELRIKQPLDHENPSKGYFYQRAYLSHAGFEQPVVLVTEGYTRDSNRIYEPTTLLSANQIGVEHRYFGASVPDSMDYRFLNLEQVSADLHRVNQLFRQIYEEPWLSTGISKGGQTTIFYRYFYPDDVAVSIPYVAPLNQAYADTRIFEFLKTAGTEECRKDIYDFQLQLLKKRREILPLLKWHARGADYSFTYLSLEEAFEYAVLEYPFSFWQKGHHCAAIPDEKASLDELIEHFNEVVGLILYTDEKMESYGSHYYQAASEMGYYGFQTEPFSGLLKVLPEKPHAAFPPGKKKPVFDSSLIKKVYQWLQTGGDNFIYIYGALDTWSATAVPPSDQVNSLWFMMEGKNHSNARIINMAETDRKKLLATVKEWMGK